ncbi:MAG: hypothetical protein WDZ29_04175 [Balneolaceae bacterium]
MNRLILYEKYSRYWPHITVLSTITSLALLIIWLGSDNVLFSGYLQFGAFVFFAIALLCLFRWREGQMKIEMDSDGHGILHIRYSVRNEPVGSEEFLLKGLESVKTDRMPDRSLADNLFKSGRTVRFKRQDSINWLYLNEVNGRVIPLDMKSAEQLRQFLEALIHRDQ